jgi:hypothetical protein
MRTPLILRDHQKQHEMAARTLSKTHNLFLEALLTSLAQSGGPLRQLMFAPRHVPTVFAGSRTPS